MSELTWGIIRWMDVVMFCIIQLCIGVERHKERFWKKESELRSSTSYIAYEQRQRDIA